MPTHDPEKADRKVEPKTTTFERDKAMPPPEIIILTGCEGGSWTLFGRRRSGGGWEFYAAADESALKGMLAPEDELGLPHKSHAPWVSDWGAALALYNQHQWLDLYPVQVHPEFREQVTEALCTAWLNRAAVGNAPGEHSMRDWLRVCDERVQEKILQVCLDDKYWTLSGVRDGTGGWHFYTDLTSHSEEPQARLVPQQQVLPSSVRTWEEAIELFDQRDWSSSPPVSVYVHPEFRSRVKLLLFRRMLSVPPRADHDDELDRRHFHEWRSLLNPNEGQTLIAEEPSRPELQDLKVKWCEWETRPVGDGGFGHGVHYHDAKISSPENDLVAAFVEDFAGYGRKDEAVIYCIAPNEITTARVIAAMKRQIERTLKKGEMPHGKITKRIWGMWNA